jgi:hypothetical protein
LDVLEVLENPSKSASRPATAVVRPGDQNDRDLGSLDLARYANWTGVLIRHLRSVHEEVGVDENVSERDRVGASSSTPAASIQSQKKAATRFTTASICSPVNSG